MAFWGYHLTLDCAGCDADAIRSHETIYRFTKQLVRDIDMVPYGEPQIRSEEHTSELQSH